MVWPELENEFSITCNILFGESLKGVDDHGPWLSRHIPLPHPAKSAVSDKIVWNFPTLNFMGRKISEKRSISMEEMDKVNKTDLSYDDIKDSGIEDMLARVIKPVAYAVGNFRWKTYSNVDKCGGAGDGMYLYYGDDLYGGIKHVAYSNYTMYSTNMFGCHNAPYSQFCIHVYNSTNMTRCFEVDGCSKCSDLFFSHNCEGMSNGILCFNAKNLRYAVGNVEVGPEKFMRIKKLLLGHVVRELKEKKSLDVDIFNVGARR